MTAVAPPALVVTPASTDSRSRRVYIDQARGLAVLLMIGAHVTDAWTRPSSRHGVVFRDLVILGGFAAPLFLWLAGLAGVLAATRAARDKGRTEAVKGLCRRGLEIFILAFLFRLQAFVVTPGSHPVTLFRVDILNIMGPAIVLAALVWGLARTEAGAVAAFALAAAVTALATPLVRVSTAVGALPTWVQWYLRPADDHAVFNLFPWAGFVFAGSACGILIAGAREEDRGRLQAALGAVGAVLVVLGFGTANRPSIYHPASSFWTSSPAWFLIRAGVLVTALPVIYAVSRFGSRRQAGGDWLSRLGRHSLFVYWIHVELVYGYLTWPIHGRLPLWGTAMAFVLFSAAMYRAIDVRDWVIERWRGRRARIHHSFASRTALGR